MRKLIVIALVVIIAIPFGLKLSESSKKPLLERVERDGFSKQPKDSLWEFVKYQLVEGRVNLDNNYAKRYQDPILLNVENATVKDSLAIVAFMKDLKELFPLKKILYFEDYVGVNFQTYTKNLGKSSFTEDSPDELASYTIHLSFNPKLEDSRSSKASYNLNDLSVNYGKRRRNTWNGHYVITKLYFGFDNKVSVEERESCISFHFFSVIWELNQSYSIDKPINPDNYRSDFTTSIVYRGNKNPLKMVGGIIIDYKFLLAKLFSNDFKKQFENYMYKTYPWRYVNVFIDKNLAKTNATAIVAFMGLLILILGCSLFWNRKIRYSFVNYFMAILIINVGLISLNILYNYLIHIDYSTNAVSGIIGSILFTGVVALVLSFLFWQIEKRIVPHKGNFGYQLLVKLGLTFLFLYLPSILMIYFSESVDSSGGEITRSLSDLQFLFIVIGLTFGRGLLIYLNHFSENLVKQKDVELSRLKQVNAQSELKLLQSHINPHFLYNALNSIAGLAHTNADKTEKMALSLSDLFRYSLNKKGQKMSTVKEEVTMVQNYLEIEKIRFGTRLKFNLHIDTELENEQIPMYMLQPLVENAIKHGISKIRGEGCIELEIKKEAQKLLIAISDNGPDFPEGLVSGHGLQTVYDLLRLSYGDKASLSWENKPVKHIIIAINNELVLG